MILILCFILCFHASAPEELPVLQNSIENSGFHRDLVSTLTIPAPLLPELFEDGDVQCYLMFTVTIPSGAYVDRDQIKSMKHHGGPDVLLASPVDIEKTEYESTDFQARVFTNLSKHGDALIGGYTLPIHLRYHEVSNQDYVKVTFNNPDIAVRCFNKKVGMTHHGYHGETVKQKSDLCSSSSVILCDWIVIQYHTERMNISIEVPVGKVEHFVIVTAGTIFTTVTGCLLLVYYASQTGKTTKVS